MTTTSNKIIFYVKCYGKNYDEARQKFGRLQGQIPFEFSVTRPICLVDESQFGYVFSLQHEVEQSITDQTARAVLKRIKTGVPNGVRVFRRDSRGISSPIL